MMMRAPSYWSRLGSSKNRTAEQTEVSKEVVKDLRERPFNLKGGGGGGLCFFSKKIF